jgi:hypothetical protein
VVARRRAAADPVKQPAPHPPSDEATRVGSMAGVQAPGVDARIVELVAGAPPLSDADRLRLAFLFRDGIAKVARDQAAGAGS